MKIKYLKPIAFVAIFMIYGSFTMGQTRKIRSDSQSSSNDSLTLEQVLNGVLKNHPSLKQAQEALTAAEAKTGLARSGYLPNIDFTAGYTHLSPDPYIPFGSLSTQLFPNNSVDASVNVYQTIYDFGKTSRNVELENQNTSIASDRVDLVRKNLTLKTIGTFYTLAYFQKAIKIKDEELKTLQEHLVYVEKKAATGSATNYELLSTKVRISNTESQKLDLESFQKTQWSVLNMLMDSTSDKMQNLKMDLSTQMPVMASDSLLNYAYNHRTELTLEKDKETLAKMNLNIVKYQNMPVLSGFLSGGYKNGYMINLYDYKLNYVAGLNLKIPIFEGNRHKYNVELAQSNIADVSFESDITRRNITNEVIEAQANYINAKKKISQYELQLEQAKEAYTLAETNYESGAITNLDLLDSETAVSESKLLLLKSKIDFMVSSYNLRLAIGNKL